MPSVLSIAITLIGPGCLVQSPVYGNNLEPLSFSLKVSWLALVSEFLLQHGHEGDTCQALASGTIETVRLLK
jgi:hypothetical protein